MFIEHVEHKYFRLCFQFVQMTVKKIKNKEISTLIKFRFLEVDKKENKYRYSVLEWYILREINLKREKGRWELDYNSFGLAHNKFLTEKRIIE